eukprot:TCALIF_13465-PA protein Name:"Protein of unknown function" AED:0.21 eAED:0.22 QI:0/-1/0/1/-1/1/1/0/113
MLMFRYDHLIEESDPGSVKCELAKAIRGNLKRRFGALEDITELAIATLLDPRFKVNGFQSSVKKDVAVEKIHSELVINMELRKVEDTPMESRQSPKKRLRSCLWELFDSRVNQ